MMSKISRGFFVKDNKLLIQILHVSQQLWSVVWISGYTALPEVLILWTEVCF